MLKYIAKIKPSGEVFSLSIPQGANNIPEGPTEDGLTVVYIDFDIDNRPLFIETQYYLLNLQTWATRERKPNPVAYWEAGVWKWNQQDLLDLVRKERAKKLYATDWTQLPDNTLTLEEKNQAAIYRQELRDVIDLCQTISKLEDVPWPIKPSFL